MNLVPVIRWFRIHHSRRCFYCGVRIPLSSEHRTEDHVVAKSKGGPEKAATNRVPCCLPCNRAKKDLSVEEFRALRYAGKPIEFYAETLYRNGILDEFRAARV